MDFNVEWTTITHLENNRKTLLDWPKKFLGRIPPIYPIKETIVINLMKL